MTQPEYQCDVCGRMATRLHHLLAGGTETIACDYCTGYDPSAYDEPPDPALLRQLSDDVEADFKAWMEGLK